MARKASFTRARLGAPASARSRDVAKILLAGRPRIAIYPFESIWKFLPQYSSFNLDMLPLSLRHLASCSGRRWITRCTGARWTWSTCQCVARFVFAAMTPLEAQLTLYSSRCRWQVPGSLRRQPTAHELTISRAAGVELRAAWNLLGLPLLTDSAKHVLADLLARVPLSRLSSFHKPFAEDSFVQWLSPPFFSNGAACMPARWTVSSARRYAAREATWQQQERPLERLHRGRGRLEGRVVLWVMLRRRPCWVGGAGRRGAWCELRCFGAERREMQRGLTDLCPYAPDDFLSVYRPAAACCTPSI